LASQISCLHNQCPANNEWSGILIYEVTAGNIDELEKLSIKAHAVFPMDFGNGAYTEYESSPQMLKIFEIYPQIDPVKKDPKWFIGHIHSHHNMSTFFSGTDQSELLTNVKNLPIYLSLIVNYACMPCAKIAIMTDAEESKISILHYKLRGSEKKKKRKNRVIETSPESAYVIDCDVTFEQVSWFIDQVKVVKSIVKTVPIHNSQYNYGGGYGYGYGSGYYNDNYKPTLGFKPAGETVKKADHDYEYMGLAGKYRATDPIYIAALNGATDLFTLGQKEGSTLSAAKALQVVNLQVKAEDKEKYQNAIKGYFVDDWFPSNYYKLDNATEEDAIDALLQLLKYNEKVWISAILTKALNDLKNELPKLREV